MIVLGDSETGLHEFFTSLQYVGTSADNRYALGKEIPQFICRGPKFGTPKQLWLQVKKSR